MDQKPQPKRGLSRALIYGFIPGGFILLVLFLVFSGAIGGDEPAEMTEAREKADAISDAEESSESQ